MKTPMNILQDFVVVPLHQVYKKVFSKKARGKFFNTVTDFIFDCSKETALIMLVFNAISIMSSHIAQIGGLKKSKRENKEYLITQEKQELGLDLILTIIPPFMLNNFLKKKLESGEITTREARDKLINVVAPVVGASRDELYSTEHIRPIKETLASVTSKLSTTILKKNQKLPAKVEDVIRKVDKKAKSILPDAATILPSVSLEDIASDFDNLAKEKRISSGILKKFRNGSAYDDLCGQNNGILIMTTIAYSILASNIIMPILKNKLSNRSYEKQLAKMGETKESIKRKKRFEYNNAPILSDKDKNFFNVFSNSDNSVTRTKQDSLLISEKIKEPERITNPFQSFDTYNTIASQSLGLRI